MVMAEEAIGHLRETIRVDSKVEVWDRNKKMGSAHFDSEEEDGVPPMASFGEGEHLSVTGSTHEGYGFRKTDDPKVHARLVRRINKKILNHKGSITEVEDYFLDEAEVAIIAYGFTARTSLYVVKRLRKEGHKVGMLRLKTLWPFPDEAVAEVGKRVKKIMVPEMNLGQVAGEVKKYVSCDVISLSQTNGEVIRPERILGALRKI